jgi:SNF2 family DNA or RNA helicase
MITTGTPLENNLSELWSLFRFVNPGLLGNLKTFNRRFAQPIEQSDEDPIKAKKAAFGLKTLLNPFILRRLKSEVLTELPPRTHIDIHVPLNEQERHLYEAIRVNAVEKLAAIQKEQSIATQRMQIFAELTKLRQACSNPSLVSPDTDIESSKLKQLTLLLTELRENRHKALIFSQFIGSLQAVKAILEAQQIPFHYIDGATPAEQRKQSVNAFQRGEGEIFLISLKAGGSGLNLTAADYVIHLDPWWNPAVEAQASDRAHRIGQTKPVTVYRLVAEQTIEDKILALHEHKKELADKLLDEGNAIDALSVQELLGLLKETF